MFGEDMVGFNIIGGVDVSFFLYEDDEFVERYVFDLD